MTLRTRLMLAFLGLAVVPLVGLTLFSYASSVGAYRHAVEAQSRAAAEDMGARIAGVTSDLNRGLARIGETRLAVLERQEGRADGRAALDEAAFAARARAELGAAAPYVEALEFTPAPAPAIAQAEKERPSSRAAPPAPVPPAPPAAAPDPVPPAPPPARRVVIQLSEVMDPETAARVARIVAAGDAARNHTGDPAGALEATVEAGLRSHLEEEGLEAEEAAAVAGALADAGRALVEDFVQTETGQKALKAAHEAARALLGRGFGVPIEREGVTVGHLEARVRAEELITAALGAGRRGSGEVPFAIDASERLHVADESQREQVAALLDAPSPREARDWVVVKRKDTSSGLTLGIARPIGAGLDEIRRAALVNLAGGLLIAGLALVGILPLSRRMTRDLEQVTAGAERLAAGELDARVPVRSRDEVGRLASTFNRMAQELRAHQDQLLEQERLRKELEVSRRIQEELLPREPLRATFVQAEGVSIPAREVGGDFFNYFALPAERVALLVGDVSGKGVPAALLMANLQATLRSRLPIEDDLATLARRLDEEMHASSSRTTFVTLFLAVLEPDGATLRYVNAGHNPPFLLRADAEPVALEATGRPLGLLPGGGYEERRVALAPADLLFLYTDGLTEAENASEEPFGEARLVAALRAAARDGVDGVLRHVEEAAARFRGVTDAADDATLLAIRFGTVPSSQSKG
jgi:serine phosphatase RsbU (regulator of sigma subunit)